MGSPIEILAISIIAAVVVISVISGLPPSVNSVRLQVDE